jgi:hypothetical protein
VEPCEKMHSERFQNVLDRARETRPHVNEDAIGPVKILMDRLSADDFALEERMANLDRRWDWSTKTLFSEGELHAGLFMIPKGNKIPLHDHPEMTVFFKVLWGRLRLKAYDWEHGFPFEGLANLRQDAILDGAEATHVVRPVQSNIHSIEALEDCAFVDLFAPPYSKEEGRVCRNYRELGYLERDGGRFMQLEHIK